MKFSTGILSFLAALLPFTQAQNLPFDRLARKLVSEIPATSALHRSLINLKADGDLGDQFTTQMNAIFGESDDDMVNNVMEYTRNYLDDKDVEQCMDDMIAFNDANPNIKQAEDDMSVAAISSIDFKTTGQGITETMNIPDQAVHDFRKACDKADGTFQVFTPLTCTMNDPSGSGESVKLKISNFGLCAANTKACGKIDPMESMKQVLSIIGAECKGGKSSKGGERKLRGSRKL